MDVKRKPVYCFIDGFNLFHAINELKPNHGNHLKWLNLRGLSNAFIQHTKEKLEEVFYFSAYPTWRPKAHKTHRKYVKALEAYNVKCILGHFKEKRKQCPQCKSQWIAHEEKESDVNIGIHLLHHAHLNSFDKAFIVTADSDLIPAVKLALNTFPEKEFTILVPPSRYDITRELRSHVKAMRIGQRHLRGHQLPKKITRKDGEAIIAPQKYIAQKKHNNVPTKMIKKTNTERHSQNINPSKELVEELEN